MKTTSTAPKMADKVAKSFTRLRNKAASFTRPLVDRVKKRTDVAFKPYERRSSKHRRDTDLEVPFSKKAKQTFKPWKWAKKLDRRGVPMDIDSEPVIVDLPTAMDVDEDDMSVDVEMCLTPPGLDTYRDSLAVIDADADDVTSAEDDEADDTKNGVSTVPCSQTFDDLADQLCLLSVSECEDTEMADADTNEPEDLAVVAEALIEEIQVTVEEQLAEEVQVKIEEQEPTLFFFDPPLNEPAEAATEDSEDDLIAYEDHIAEVEATVTVKVEDEEPSLSWSEFRTAEAQEESEEVPSVAPTLPDWPRRRPPVPEELIFGLIDTANAPWYPRKRTSNLSHRGSDKDVEMEPPPKASRTRGNPYDKDFARRRRADRFSKPGASTDTTVQLSATIEDDVDDLATLLGLQTLAHDSGSDTQDSGAATMTYLESDDSNLCSCCRV